MKIATVLADLIAVALSLKQSDIRCTSATPYALSGGVDFNAVLKDEVAGAQVVIGLITPYSLQSSYVLFELGARWGANLLTIPLIACGVTASQLPGPLSTIKSLDCADASQVHQLISNIANAIPNAVAVPPHTYQHLVDRLVRLAKVKRKQDSPLAGLRESAGFNTVKLAAVFESRTAAASDIQRELKSEKAAVDFLTGRGSDLDSHMFHPLLDGRKSGDRRILRVLLPATDVSDNETDWLKINDAELAYLSPNLSLETLREQIRQNMRLIAPAIPTPFVQVNSYNAPQIGRIIIFSNCVYFNPYLSTHRGKAAPVFKFEKLSVYYEIFTRYFNMCWASATRSH